MKTKPILGGLAALALLPVVNTEVQASQVTIAQVAGYSFGNGGEFLVTPDSSLSGVLAGYDSKAMLNGGFFSFCIERNEHVTSGTTYNAQISPGAIGGGVSGAVNGTDKISNGVAWLYSQFAQGSLAGYDYDPTGGRSTAGVLQEAIWFLEGELSSIGSNAFINAAVSQFGSLADAIADANGAFGVQALNLGASPRFRNQDQLVYVPSVPDGGTTAALLGLGMMGLVTIRRKFAAM